MLSVLRQSRVNQILSRRSICTGYPNLISEKAYQTFKLKQAKMQSEDNRPTYLKCGLRDKILYWACWTATICSTIISLKNARELINKN